MNVNHFVFFDFLCLFLTRQLLCVVLYLLSSHCYCYCNNEYELIDVTTILFIKIGHIITTATKFVSLMQRIQLLLPILFSRCLREKCAWKLGCFAAVRVMLWSHTTPHTHALTPHTHTQTTRTHAHTFAASQSDALHLDSPWRGQAAPANLPAHSVNSKMSRIQWSKRQFLRLK